MKLLFDENLSPKLADLVAAPFAGSMHVRTAGLVEVDDLEVWHYAAKNDFVIVTKDADYDRLSALYGPPPKVIWLRVGNCSTEKAAAVLAFQQSEIVQFAADPDHGTLILK